MNWFINCTTEAEKKTRYRLLIKYFHPDTASAGIKEMDIQGEATRSILLQYEGKKEEKDVSGLMEEAIKLYKIKYPSIQWSSHQGFLIASGTETYILKENLKMEGFSWDRINIVWKKRITFTT